ncbi:hypothetical protein Q2941_45520, partial [Bradyrhizobium sp. UFLA05-153]
RQADVFTDLAELQSKIGRDSSERPALRNRSETRTPQSLQRGITGATEARPTNRVVAVSTAKPGQTAP